MFVCLHLFTIDGHYFYSRCYVITLNNDSFYYIVFIGSSKPIVLLNDMKW